MYLRRLLQPGWKTFGLVIKREFEKMTFSNRQVTHSPSFSSTQPFRYSYQYSENRFPQRTTLLRCSVINARFTTTLKVNSNPFQNPSENGTLLEIYFLFNLMVKFFMELAILSC